MQRPHKYARVERERRFLLDRFPSAGVVRTRHMTDRYLDGTQLRLREQTDDGGPATYKLTQKIPARAGGAQQGLITTIYLTGEEFRLLAQLPAKMLSKVRHSVPPLVSTFLKAHCRACDWPKQSSTRPRKPMP
jgi:hypothetical protein